MISLRFLCLLLPLLLLVLIWTGRQTFSAEESGLVTSGRQVVVEKKSPAAVLFSNAPAEFERWLTDYHRDQKSADLATGIALAKERRAILKRTIELDPERALELVVSEKDRVGLPVEVRELLEIPVSTAGEFERVVSCYLGGLEKSAGAPDEERFVTFDQKRYRAFTFGRRAELQTKDRISLHGISIDDVLAFSPDPVKEISADGLLVEAFGEQKSFTDEDEREHYVAMLVADESAPGPESPGVTGASPWTEGDKRILYLRVRFADDAADYEPVTLATAQSHQDDVAEHYRIASYGKLNVTTVFPDMITLTENKSAYVGLALGKMINEARDAAIVMGIAEGVDWDYHNFDLYTIISDRGIGSYAGIAQVGGPKSHHQRGSTSLRTAGHEFGHNLGLSHAYYNYSSDLSPRGSTPTNGLGRVEYGHRFSVMSAQSGSDFNNPAVPHFTVHEKWRLDWLTDEDFEDIETSNQNGTYRIYQNDEEYASGLRAMRLPSGGALSRYWLSYRTAWKEPNRSSDNDYLLNGILFNWTTSGGGTSTLLDMTPYSDEGSTGGASWTRDNNDKWDAPLLLGRTYTDPETKVSVTPVARGGEAPDEYIDVHVHFATGEEVTLVAENDNCRALIPDASTAADWAALSYDDIAWPFSGSLGVGYERSSGYESFIGVDVEAMRGGNRSCYIRIPFTIEAGTDLADIESLMLRMRYDDGFVAYLNGVKIAEDHAPVSPTWNSGATEGHFDSFADDFQEFSASAGLAALVEGVNVLAIHGLNDSSTSSDFLIQPTLVASFVPPSNSAPQVSLAADTLVVAVNQDVTLTATATDPEGDTLAYAWDFDIGDEFAPEGLNSPLAVRRWSSAGLYAVTVTCSDRKGGISRDRVIVKVGNPANDGVVTGRVIQGGLPVAGARVFVEGTDRQSVTREDGSYVMAGLSTTLNTTLGVMFDGEVFQSSVVMPITPDPELNGVDFWAHGEAPTGQKLTLSPAATSAGLSVAVPLTASLWENSIAAEMLIPFGDTWSYLDTGVDPGASWTTAGFDDGAWLSGAAELGYGDGQETTVSFGGNTSDRHITTWFRRSFAASNVAEISRLKMTVKRDDGIRVFLNGSEIARDNLTTGTVSAGTTASNDVTSANEAALLQFSVDPALLLEGENIIAVEVHQEDDRSNDLSFDLELSAARNLSEIAPTWSVIPAGATVSEDGIFTAILPGDYTVTATSGSLSAVAEIAVTSDIVVTIAAADRFLWENGSETSTVRISRTGSMAGVLVVPLMVGGEAVGGSDFSGVPDSVTIPAGEATTEFEVTVLDDAELEGNEVLSIGLEASVLFEVGDSALATVVIVDDENDIVQVPEAGSDATVAVNEPFSLEGLFLQEVQLITAGNYWKFDDNGAALLSGWNAPAFSDGDWQEGLAKFGYGDDDEMTTVSFGNSSSNKHITTYFRRRFHLENAASYTDLTASLLVDDGAVIYLNGNEVRRVNMPGGTISFSTRASSSVDGDDEVTFTDWSLDPADLVTGENLLAVEVHQSSSSSSDLGFDLALAGSSTGPGEVIWRKKSGTGNASFEDGSDPTTSVTFDETGTYVLEMEAVESGLIDEVTITVEPTQSYLQWLADFDVSEVGRLADPDRDGLVNLMEFALGGDPSGGGENVRPVLVEDGEATGDLLFGYRRLRELNSGDGIGTTGNGYSIYGINYTVQAAVDFSDWGSAGLAMEQEGEPVDNGDGTETVTVRLTPPESVGGSWFVRLRVAEDE